MESTGARAAAGNAPTRRQANAARKQSRRDTERAPKPFDDRHLLQAGFEHVATYPYTDDGEVLYEVANGSNRHLPFLSIGIRGKVGNLECGVWLPVGHIAPGQTAVVAKETYRDQLDPSDVEAFPLPDPEPEERARYWEFREVARP